MSSVSVDAVAVMMMVMAAVISSISTAPVEVKTGAIVIRIPIIRIGIWIVRLRGIHGNDGGLLHVHIKENPVRNSVFRHENIPRSIDPSLGVLISHERESLNEVFV